MAYNEATKKWVPSQRKAPKTLRAQALADNDPDAIAAARAEELDGRPRWGGSIKPTKPLKPLERTPRQSGHRHDDASTASVSGYSRFSSAASARSTAASSVTVQGSSACVALPPLRGAKGSSTTSARKVTASAAPHLGASPNTARPRLVGIDAAVDDGHHHHRSRAARIESGLLAKRSSLPGHFPLHLSDTVPMSDEIATFAKDVAEFERKVPYTVSDLEDDDEGAPVATGRGRLRAAATVIATTHTLASQFGNDVGPPGPNVLCGILVRVPIPDIWSTYVAMETAHMRKYGLCLADFVDLVRRLVPDFDASERIVARGFDMYEPSVRSPENHVNVVQFIGQFGREMSTAAEESDFMFFFDVASGAAARRKAQANVKPPTAGASARRPSSKSAKNQAPPQQPAAPSPSQPAGRRGSIARLSHPDPASASAVIVPGAVGDAAPSSSSNAPTLSAGLIVADNLKRFIKANVRSGVARAAWNKLAVVFEEERAHMLAMLRYLSVDTAAFEPPPPRTDIERKVLGDVELPPFAKLSLIQWRFIAYTNTRIHAAIKDMWFPLEHI